VAIETADNGLYSSLNCYKGYLSYAYGQLLHFLSQNLSQNAIKLASQDEASRREL
jgi:hypothetical protein